VIVAMTTAASPSPLAVVERLQDAMNAHDLDALVACFTPDHDSRTPAHPERDFTGDEQVRRNWSQILAAVPDLHAALLRSVVDRDTAWCEWDWSGTRRDGEPHVMRGVTLTTVRDGRIAATRFYMEPVTRDGLDAGAAVQATLARPGMHR
jgi:ketosteroid isomerase-like protein